MAMPATHYLRKAWLAVTLAVTLSSGMAAPAQAQTARQPQRQEQTYADPVQGLQAEFNKTPLGQNLLRFTQQYNIGFHTDTTLAARRHKAEYNPDTGNVGLRPGLSADELAITGAHEVRHGYQDKKLGVTQLENTLISPWQRWVLRRYLEADAISYAGFFGADRMEKGIRIGDGFTRTGASSQIAMAVRGELQFSRDGLTPTEFLKLGLMPAFADLDIYNENQLQEVTRQVSLFEQDVRQAASNPRKLQELSRRMAATPSDAGFEAVLRGFGTLAPDFKPLQNVPQQTLLQEYPRIATNVDGFDKKLDTAMRDLTARHAAAMGQLQGMLRKANLRPGA